MLQGAATLGLLGGGYLSDKLAGSQPRRRMLLQTIFYVIAAPFLLTFVAQPPILILNAAIFMFSFCGRIGTTNETPLLCDLLPVKLRSTAIGLMNAANCFAGGLGVMVAGFLKSAYGLHGIFAGLSGLMFVGAILTTIGYRFFLARDLARREQPALDVAAVSAH
jgi:MFS family permease